MHDSRQLAHTHIAGALETSAYLKVRSTGESVNRRLPMMLRSKGCDANPLDNPLAAARCRHAGIWFGFTLLLCTFFCTSDYQLWAKVFRRDTNFELTREPSPVATVAVKYDPHHFLRS